MDSVEGLRDRLDALLERTGKSHTDLWQAIPMTESGYWKMLKRGSAMIDELRHYGTDVDTSKGFRPSPYRTE